MVVRGVETLTDGLHKFVRRRLASALRVGVTSGAITFAACTQSDATADRSATEIAAAKPPELWTCPMHPEIQGVSSETLCSKCNMKLEPASPTTEDAGDDVAHWTCPMHPSVRAPEQSPCPLCGMDLTEVRASERATGAVRIEATRRQQFGISTEHVCFVSIDFANEEVFDKLTESGFDPAKKTLFLWEGVTLYLREADVRATLQKVGSRAAKGSVLLADLYAQRMVSLAKKGALKKTLDYTNEGLGFGIDLTKNYEEELSKFVESESLVVGETFFMGSNNEKGPFMVVVEMKSD